MTCDFIDGRLRQILGCRQDNMVHLFGSVVEFACLDTWRNLGSIRFALHFGLFAKHLKIWILINTQQRFAYTDQTETEGEDQCLHNDCGWSTVGVSVMSNVLTVDFAIKTKSISGSGDIRVIYRVAQKVIHKLLSKYWPIMQLRYDGRFSTGNHFITNFPQNVPVKII